jgi:predicted MFS family arabinose efflux permease
VVANHITGWTRFQNNFYMDNGLSSSQIGTLKSIGLVFKFLGEPIWCFLADMTDSKIIFALCIFMQIATMEIMRIATPLTYQTILVVKILRTTTAPSTTLTTTASFKLTEGTNQGFGQQRMFGSLAWGGGAFIAGYLIDAYGMHALFYYTYFFNVISFVFVVFGLPSKLSKSSPKAVEHRHDARAISNADTTTIALATGSRSGNDGIGPPITRSRSNSSGDGRSTPEKPIPYSLPSLSPSASTAAAPAASSSYQHHFEKQWRELRQFFMNMPCRIILLNAFCYGVVMSVTETFLYISLEQDYSASRTFSGLCTTTSILSCLPLFWYSESLIRRFGHHKMIYVAQVSCVLRLVGFALLPLHWEPALYMIMGIQLLHGFNFALFWAATVDIIFKLSPKELSTSCMSTLNVIYFTLAQAAGNFIWGYVYDYGGGVFSVYVASAMMLFMNLMYFGTTEDTLKAALAYHSGHGSEDGETDALLSKA